MLFLNPTWGFSWLFLATAGFSSDSSRLGCVGGTLSSILLVLEVVGGVALANTSGEWVPPLFLVFSATLFFLLLLLCHSFLYFASLFHFFHSNEPSKLFLVPCGGGSNKDLLGFLVMEEFAEAHLWRGEVASSSCIQLYLLTVFNSTCLLLLCSILPPLQCNTKPLSDFAGQQQRGCGLWTSLLGKIRLWLGSDAGRVQQISKATMVMIDKASNEQGNGSWLCSKGASSP